ncbi:uncharacterized protein LOC5504885 isoform X2 [Nematostella vectensis]|uniref:uncharacterized protein LOC5504885 isoform X2 n=1 Tax=Nematostella vectensis TaxID=45351 RepID=UPI00138FDA3B|nr:uncharacterized protein LOC5504885 isoform X2 [Nematostella vectensis]
MGQCLGTDCAGLCPRWSYRQQSGFDRYTKFAPKNNWKYGDEHLLSEIQDPRSDDEFDFSDMSSELSPKRKSHDSPLNKRNNENDVRKHQPQKNSLAAQKSQYTTVTIDT